MDPEGLITLQNIPIRWILYYKLNSLSHSLKYYGVTGMYIIIICQLFGRYETHATYSRLAVREGSTLGIHLA